VISEDCVIGSSSHRISISKNYINKAIEAYGQYDLHFSAFLIHKLEDFFPLIHYFAFCKNSTKISEKYA
jgi:hypothetical protein